jgi:hypothetical protein
MLIVIKSGNLTARTAHILKHWRRASQCWKIPQASQKSY